MIDWFVIPSCEESDSKDERNKRDECCKQHKELLVFHLKFLSIVRIAPTISDGRSCYEYGLPNMNNVYVSDAQRSRMTTRPFELDASMTFPRPI